MPNDVRVIIRALPDDAPASVRLRRWLKLGLRTFGLRCVSVEEVPIAASGLASAASCAPEPTPEPSGRGERG